MVMIDPEASATTAINDKLLYFLRMLLYLAPLLLPFAGQTKLGDGRAA